MMPHLKTILPDMDHLLNIAVIGYQTTVFIENFMNIDIPIVNNPVVTVYTAYVPTNKGVIPIRFYDIPFINISPPTHVDAYIVIFDKTIFGSYGWAQKYIKTLPTSKSIILCGNIPSEERLHTTPNDSPEYISISTMTYNNWHKPVTKVMEGVFGWTDVVL